MGSSDEDEPLLTLQHKTRNPIVYTTKLDDMRIFNEDLTGMDAETIINCIIKESKPKLKRKRTCTEAINSRCLNEDSPSHISTSNRKVPRTAEDKKIDICKPVKVALVDIKYTLLRQQSTGSSISETVKTKRPLVSEKPKEPTYRFPRKLKSRLIYDRQLKEADLYSLDKNFFVKEHNKLPIVSTNESIFEKLKYDKNVSEVSCCCWYNREQFLTSTMLGILPHETLRFMRKPHKCEFNRCTCCCRDKSISVSNDTSAQRPRLLKPSEAPSIWVKTMSVTHASQSLSNESRKSLLSKALSVEPSEIKYPVKSSLKVEPNFLHSTSIDFGAEYHEIGADGQIKLSLKNIGKDRQELVNLKSKTTDNIVGNICCWFKREEFAGRLLVLGALPNTVNFLRSAHPCSPIYCSCCCKPSITEKPKLTLIHKAARHTNDLVRKKANIIVKFAGVVEKPVKPVKPMSVRAAIVPKNTKVVSFNVSLSALEKISKGKVTVDSILKDVIDLPHDLKKSSVRVLVEKEQTANNRTVVIECNTDLNGLTTSELTLLDIIFRAVNRAKQPVTVPVLQKDKYTIRRPRVKNLRGIYYNSIHPLLLNTHLSVTTDLRNKRFLPPLRAHLEQYRLSEMVSNINLWMAQAEQLSRK